MKEVKKMSADVRARLLAASAQRLPDRPTAVGMTPDDVRRTRWAPMLSEELSLATEQDRIAEEVNEALASLAVEASGAVGSLAIALSEEVEERKGADAALEGAIESVLAREDERERLRDAREEELQAATEASLEEMRTALSEGLSGKLDRVAGEHFAVYGESPSGAKLYPLEDETCGGYSVVQRDRYGRICAASPVSTSPDAAVINKGYLEGEIQKVNEAIKEGDDALRGAVAGKTASFVIEDAVMLEALLSGAWSVGGSSFDASVLNTGDNVFIIDVDLPDLWFEATNDFDRVAETLTVKDADGAEREIVLDVKGYQTGSRIGLLHVLEGAKHVSVDLEALGDIDTALDAILEIQNALIGGASA